MKTSFFFAGLCVLSFLLSGCAEPLLVPDIGPTPIFTKAGNVHIAGYAGTNSYDAHLAVSPIDHIGLVGRGSWAFGKKEKDDPHPGEEVQETHSHRYYEGGLGYYFSPFEYKNDMMRIEIFAGYGKGTAHGGLESEKATIFGFTIPIKNVDAKYRRYYFQLNTAICPKLLPAHGESSPKGALEYGSVIRYYNVRFSDFTKAGVSLGQGSFEGNYLQIGPFVNIDNSGIVITAQIGSLLRVSDASTSTTHTWIYLAAGLMIRLW
jgi:hypothetical protein